jgi:hypothetical protein
LARLNDRLIMSLQTRRPPGHAKRKALAYSADILSLRRAGHSLAAIREALEDAGVLVSISTVRREVLKSASMNAASKQAVIEPAASLPLDMHAGRPRRKPAEGPATVSRSEPAATLLPGKAIAEEFMRGRPTNALFLKEPSK